MSALNKSSDMEAIYNVAKKVYMEALTTRQGVEQLSSVIEVSEASIKMYFAIYACMRKGKVYKMGTSEAFTQYLLLSILRDEGEVAFEKALTASKSNYIYRENCNNAQPGIRRACERAIAESGLELRFDDVSIDKKGLTNNCEDNITSQETTLMDGVINLPNSEFAKKIMSALEKYQVLSEEELKILCDKDQCSDRFKSSYAFLKEVSLKDPIDNQIKDSTGRNRYYSTVYQLNGRSFVFTSQLYGLGNSPTTRDNRTPFYEWVVKKLDSHLNQWWPAPSEYSPGISKDAWINLLNDAEIFTESALTMIAEFFAFGGMATCAQLANHYGKTNNYYLMTSVHLAERIVKATGCPVVKDDKNAQNAKWWPVLYVGKDAGKDEKGTYIWRIRDELYEALTEFGIERYLSKAEDTVRIGVFDSWEIIDESTAIKHCDKSFFDYRGSGVPKSICWFFGAQDMALSETKAVTLIYNGKQYQGSVKNESTDRRRVRIFWNTELGALFSAFNVPGAAAIFKKITDDTYEVSIEGGEKELTIKEKVAAIKAYIAAKGFNYEGDLIENFYLSLKSKPFVILAGTSGTGKTKLVEYFAEAIDAPIHLVPVRPDWSDSSDLFGHKDLSGNFQPGAIIDFLKAATENRSIPHFLCLDEMNLARVEHYMSDLLSIIETRKFNDQHTIVTKPLIGKDDCRCYNGRNDYGEMGIPENLYIIGTVNMDETTFPFSKKVLDRANTIEFSFVNLMARVSDRGQAIVQKQDNGFLKADYLHLLDCDDEELVNTVCFNLEELNQILVKANLHVGYRVRDEISFYMMNNKKAELLDFDVAFDHEIMQKILPRVQGSSSAIKNVLSELFAKCAGDYSGFAGTAAYEQMDSYLESKTCKYPTSAKKIAFMMRRYEEDGFTSYWL